MKAIQDPLVNLPCFQLLSQAESSEEVYLLCSAPADGAAGHLCSVSNADAALTVLESNCEQELLNEEPHIFELYMKWYTEPYIVHDFCVRDGDGICFAQQFASGVGNFSCSTCERKLTDKVYSWKPARNYTTIIDPMYYNRKIAKETVDSCKFMMDPAIINTRVPFEWNPPSNDTDDADTSEANHTQYRQSGITTWIIAISLCILMGLSD
jgi:hypothetical protein